MKTTLTVVSEEVRTLRDRMGPWRMSKGEDVMGIYVPAGTSYRAWETRDAGYVNLDKPRDGRILFRV
jgi:hypothetical protein